MRQVARENHFCAELEVLVFCYAILNEALSCIDVFDLDGLSEPLLLVSLECLRGEKFYKAQRFLASLG